MFKDEQRHKVWSDLGQYGLRCFADKLSSAVLAEAATRAGVRVVHSPLCVMNLAWLGIAAAWHRTRNFAEVLQITWAILEDSESNRFRPSPGRSRHERHGKKTKAQKKARRSKRDPHGTNGSAVTEEAFAQARQRMPMKYWASLLLLLVEMFQARHSRFVCWNGFRLLALDGTCIDLPSHAALRSHYGRPSGRHGVGRCPQARMALLQFPLARLPYQYELGPYFASEISLAERLLPHLQTNDLVLLDRGFWCFWLLAGIQNRGAFFGIRVKTGSRLETVKQLGPGDRLVRWTPHPASLRRWQRQGHRAPDAMTFRVIDYQIPGFRPSAIATNVVDPTRISRDDWTRLTTQCEPGRRLLPGLYHFRWEIETTFRELKITQQWHRQHWLRSHTPHSIEYEIAGHVLLYFLIRWMMVDAAADAGVDPLRLSFTTALHALEDKFQHFVIATEQHVAHCLLPGLLKRIASGIVPYRPGRHFPRPGDTKPKSKGRNQWQLPAKLSKI